MLPLPRDELESVGGAQLVSFRVRHKLLPCNQTLCLDTCAILCIMPQLEFLPIGQIKRIFKNSGCNMRNS